MIIIMGIISPDNDCNDGDNNNGNNDDDNDS